nr:hypothetical protein [Nocardioides panacis]
MSAATRCGASYGDRSASRSNSEASPPRPVETTTRSWSRARSSRSCTVAERTTTLPPRRSISSISSGTRTRWSSERAGVLSRVANAAVEPSSRVVS